MTDDDDTPVTQVRPRRLPPVPPGTPKRTSPLEALRKLHHDCGSMSAKAIRYRLAEVIALVSKTSRIDG